MFAALAKYVSIGLEIEEVVTGKIYTKYLPECNKHNTFVIYIMNIIDTFITIIISVPLITKNP